MKVIILTISLFLLSFQSFSKIRQAKPWLGIAIETSSSGVLIKQITDKSPAKSSSLKNNDIIYKINNQKISNAKELIDLIQTYQVGDKVSVFFYRGNKNLSDTIKLSARPELVELARRMLINKKYINFEANDLNDRKIQLSNLIGKVTILEFWATWCPACRSAMPKLKDFALKNNKIQIITVTDEKISLIKKFIKKQKMDESPIMHLSSKEAGPKYFAISIPYFILIDKAGNINHLQIGAGDSLDELLKKAKSLN